MKNKLLSISVKGLSDALLFFSGVSFLITIPLFFFWLADWHIKANVIFSGERTVARIVQKDEEWSRWTSSSAQEAYKDYYITFEYEDSSGQAWSATWDSSPDLFERVREGSPLPIRYLHGPSGGAIPEGETFQAFIESGAFGPAGIVGLIFLLGEVPFIILLTLKRFNGEVL